MSGLNIKWAALFVFLILLPASILTYLSARAFSDAQRSVLAGLNLLIPRLQQALDQRLEELTARAAAAPRPRELKIPEIEQVIILDAEGWFSDPPYLPLTLSDRSPEFAVPLERGVELEFHSVDFNGARQAYAEALDRARSPRETVEALDALSRLALTAGQQATAIQLHQQLEAHADILDPDGAHPLTLSYLRLAEHLPPEQALSLLEEWASNLLAGVYPLFPGCRYFVDRFAAQIRDLPLSGDRKRTALDRLEDAGRLVDLAAIYTDLAAAGLGPGGTFSGTAPAGESFLVRLQPCADGAIVGLRFNLEALAADLLRSPASLELQGNGFGIALFDIDAAAHFDRQHRSGPRQVAPASQAIYRLNLGLFARNEVLVLRNYRNRNLFIMAGIFLLAGAIAGGAYLLFRDTARELQTARLRSEFVANVSHELRTPLTAIRMYAETLALGRYRSQNQLQEYLETIMHESQRLARMVGNVLDFSRMESGRKTYDFAAVDLGAVARRTAEEFGPLLQERDFSLELSIETGLPPMRADADAVATALANLLNNAVKYSAECRQIHLAVRAAGPFQIIEVADRGIGVPAEEANRIFEKF